ncbi:sporulation protein YtxC [Bacillus sp. 03113]|uniref:sporulation protein YtxC n=1 Tax=Bacillus sp. 03113 TaxID=2578211 RepID=UPI0011447F90|nr:sporulation protein YtxC [Bacillus sp. 03113]
MIEIIFQSKEDAVFFQQQLSSYTYNHSVLPLEDQYIVKIENHFEATSELKEIYYQFIMRNKLDRWVLNILATQYFFEDMEEQQQILDIINSVIEGEREELTRFLQGLNLEQCLKNEIDYMFKSEVAFSFDSFVKFRLRSFIKQLKKYIEVSIDEYKMEQEYQMFIHTLRNFLLDRPARLSHLHLLIEDGIITFFNEQFCEMKRAELVRMIDRKLLINHPVYVDSISIAPLLSIAPRTIFLYTEDIEQPLVRTIQNIFEERVQTKSKKSFYDLKKIFPSPVDENCH